MKETFQNRVQSLNRLHYFQHVLSAPYTLNYEMLCCFTTDLQYIASFKIVLFVRNHLHALFKRIIEIQIT